MGPDLTYVFFTFKTATLEPELQISESHPSSVVFACKTATFESELQVSIGPRFRLLICECKTACFDAE